MADYLCLLPLGLAIVIAVGALQCLRTGNERLARAIELNKETVDLIEKQRRERAAWWMELQNNFDRPGKRV